MHIILCEEITYPCIDINYGLEAEIFLLTLTLIPTVV